VERWRATRIDVDERTRVNDPVNTERIFNHDPQLAGTPLDQIGQERSAAVFAGLAASYKRGPKAHVGDERIGQRAQNSDLGGLERDRLPLGDRVGFEALAGSTNPASIGVETTGRIVAPVGMSTRRQSPINGLPSSVTVSMTSLATWGGSSSA
jgi:hypothetical protein